MLTLLIVLCFAYAAIFAGLWLLYRFERPAPAKPAPRFTRFLAWKGGLYVEAPTDRETVDAFLKLDHDLAEMGR